MVVIFETLTGAVLEEVQPAAYTWSLRANVGDSVEMSFPLDTLDGARNLLSEINHSVAIDVGGRWVGGPIMPHQLSAEDAELQVGARGIREAIFASRSVLPPAALTKPLAPDGLPDTTLDTVLSGYDYGTIGKKLVQQACSWPGSGYPVLYHADRAGDRYQSYSAVDRVLVDTALGNLSALEHGPDIRLALQRFDQDTFGWLYESGTEDNPRMQSGVVFAWDLDVTSKLTVRTDPTRMGSVVWSQGGRSSDRTLVEMTYDPYLVDRDFPLLELESDASSSTVLAATLRAHNAETLRTARRPWEFWSFSVSATVSPFPFEYNVGDLCEVVVGRDTHVTGGYISPGRYQRRIVGLSGDQDYERITITCGAIYDA